MKSKYCHTALDSAIYFFIAKKDEEYNTKPAKRRQRKREKNERNWLTYKKMQYYLRNVNAYYSK